MSESLILQIAVGSLIGLSAGYLGAFMVMRRMSLVGDALSHVALPGIAIALLYHINPFIGAFLALLVSIIIIWGLEQRTSLPSETLVGILFTVSLAIGILITPEPELLEALFGDISKIGYPDLGLTLILVAFSFLIISMIRRGIMLSILSRDLADSMGIRVGLINFAFLIMVAIVVALGLKVAGTLLMGSLVIIPAAAAKNISRSLNSYTILAGIFGIAAAACGILFASYFNYPPGPLVVLTGGLIFLATASFKK